MKQKFIKSTKKYLKEHWVFLFLMVLAFITRFLFLSYPSEAVFDEVHFGKFVKAYFTHQYYFDIHPPLGKLMIAGFAKLFNLKPTSNFLQIGEEINKKELFILRFLPALFGVFFVLLIYRFVLTIGLSKKAGFFAGFLILFDTAFLVQSKFILIDVFLLFFGFLGLFFCIKTRNKPKKKNNLFLVLSAVFSAFAFSIKWTGLSFFALVLFYLFFLEKNKKEFLKKSIVLALVFLLVYIFIFVLHFKILYKSGQGDAFMSSAFQKTLLGNKIKEDIKPLGFWQKFIELNKAMYKYNAGLKAGHQDSSRWYQWLFARKPIWYWSKGRANIYFLANPVVWFSVLGAVFLSIFLIVSSLFGKKKFLFFEKNFLFFYFLFGFFLNLLPFIFIKRATFLYHYLPSLVFGILVLVFLYDKVFKKRLPSSLVFGFLIGVFLVFLILSPLVYGFSVSYDIEKFYNFFLIFFGKNY